jgi:hypothetical protein
MEESLFCWAKRMKLNKNWKSAHMPCNDGTLAALQRHCTENSIQIFPELKLLGLVFNSYIHGSVNDLHIPRIGFACFAAEK